MENHQSIVAELEGTLLRDSDLFPYFMLIAFEASGLLRFIVLLLACPIIRLLDLLHLHDYALRLMVFVALAGIHVEEIEAVARAVLPKFYVDGLDGAAWGVFSLYERRVVVTRFPRLMVEWFAKEYLRAYEVVGAELEVNRFGYATGLMKRVAGEVGDQVMEVLAGERPDAGMGREEVADGLLASCKEQLHPPYEQHGSHSIDMPRVIFHDSRLVHLPTPLVALTIILYIPFGIMICATRIIIGLSIPIRYACLVIHMLGGVIRVRGCPPPPASSSNKGVLFVCTHRSLMDPVVLATVLGRRVPAVTYSISRLSEIISPIPTVRLTRNRYTDAKRIKAELEKGDVVVCPEGTTCREPFLLRFSGLFAELTDRIVPVAANNRLGFFHATTARGWKAMDPIVFFMNPKPSYDVTFLDQLPLEATYAGGKSPHDVANYVQRILAETLGFECTNLTRKDKYRALVGHDGRASFKRTRHTKSVVG